MHLGVRVKGRVSSNSAYGSRDVIGGLLSTAIGALIRPLLISRLPSPLILSISLGLKGHCHFGFWGFGSLSFGDLGIRV